MKYIPAQFIADDGTIFYNESDCRYYEQTCTLESSNFKMYDKKLNHTKDIWAAYYIFFPIAKEIDIFNKLSYQEGYGEIKEWDETATDVIYYYDENGDKWKNFKEEEKRIQHIKDIVISKTL